MPQQDDLVDVQVHRLAANVLFDEHGLSPYRGLVRVFEPELEGRTFSYDEEDYRITNASFWNGKIADPDGNIDDGLYEYKLGVWSDDDAEEKGADFTFRPGYPDAKHIDTGETINGMPDDCPDSIRVQVEATNLTQLEFYGLLQSLAGEIDLNRKYFAPGAVHEWSRIYGLETYLRIKRAIAIKNLVGNDGIFEKVARFQSGDDGKGEWKWDHEEISGHYESVALDPNSWSQLISGHGMPKRVKCYQPHHPRAEDGDEDDPLYHHKLEAQFWAGYDDSSLDWFDYPGKVSELRETTLNICSWSGVSIRPDGETFIEDGYFDVDVTEASVEIVPNPIPEMTTRQELTARDSLLDPTVTEAEFAVLQAVTDGGGHHEDLAVESGTSSSSVYRAAERFSDILEVENGRIRFVDNIVREEISSIVERFEAAKDNAIEAVRRTANKVSPLSDDDTDDEPSALEKWMSRHGIVPRETYDGLEMELDRPVSRRKLTEILRAGLTAAEGSGFLTETFKEATIDWRDLDGNPHRNWKVVVDGEILGPAQQPASL